MIVVSLVKQGLTGKAADAALHKANITVNKNAARFAENIFMINVQIESGLNPINIKIQTAAGDQYEFNFTIQAP